MAAVRVMFLWLGVRKSLTPDQKSQAADTFGAESEFFSAGKKLLASYARPAPIRSQCSTMRNVQLTSLKGELHDTVATLDESAARLRRLPI